ncbi:family 20 glycosylhydrolase [Sanguibacter sp. 25GB23B1]|uniref:family 20 glycosylhydrolase n=2 Tax=unclassified Sanguibacter TaxID=2645534 RepID=UPI0032B000EC
MTLPLLPAPRRLTVTDPTGPPPARETVDALARALAPWAPRASRLAAGIASGLAPATAPSTRTASGTDATRDPAGTPSVTAVLDPALEDEGYELTVGPAAWELRAGGEAGAYRAVQTLHQAVRDGAVPTFTCADAPAYAVRGVMLDVARHFFPVASVERVIDLAAAYRFNELHLHLSDDQGWRLEIEGRPLLTALGSANDADGGDGGFFTRDDYRHLQEYALERHVVVVPEIDLPGHTHAAQVAYPEVSPDGLPREPYAGIEVGFSSVHLTSPESWSLIEDVVAGLARDTLGDYLHLGGDETLTLERADYLVFMERLGEVVARHGKKLALWQEATGATLPAGTRLQYWTWEIETTHLAEAARTQDVRFVASPANHAYLDQKYTEDFPLGLTWAGTVSIHDAYEWDPVAELPGVPAEAVVGVEVCLWSETLRTLDDVTTMLLPRLPAVAEVAWGSPRDYDRLTGSLVRHGRWWDAEGLVFHREPSIGWA